LIDPDHYDPSEEIFSATLATPAVETTTAASTAVAPAETFYRPQDAEPVWRAEVSSRVNNFRSRRRRPGASTHASMRFDFDAREAAAMPMASAELRALPRLEPEVAKILAFPKAVPEPVAAAALEVIPAEPRILEAEAHIEAPDIEAVAQLEALVNAEEVAMPQGEIVVEWEPSPEIHTQYWENLPEPLADPVEDATLTQVLEADPDLALPQVSPLADIALGPTPAEAAAAQTFDLVEDDVAFSIAPLFDRAVAGVIDSVVCSAASALFVGVFFAMAKPELRGLQLFAFSSLLSCLCWTLYQYIFLVHRGATLGMQFAELEVRTFNGEPAWPNERRMRVLGLALSCASLGLGFLWTLIDENGLGWHDRITRSCLVRKEEK
jgi:uncharacterized RDD family membrane protein YckC